VSFAGQFEQIQRFFGLKIDPAKLLSRCVKCNSDDQKEITRETAKSLLNWKNQDDYYRHDFRQCQSCRQIYWDGQSSANAKKRFIKFKREGLPDQV
jgi:uncharacterized protein with PIN domain